ncbi:MAG: VOC family protein [Firmicutes bacterium]|nr:VOC family protein [Bacillota bacterium]MCL5013277.1 VOC family protein [Bacillota bacterium]
MRTQILDLNYEAVGLELASVGDILIMAGSDPALDPLRQTNAVFKVDNTEFCGHLMTSSCRVIRERTRVPTGANLTVQHPDDKVSEYVQHLE